MAALITIPGAGHGGVRSSSPSKAGREAAYFAALSEARRLEQLEAQQKRMSELDQLTPEQRSERADEEARDRAHEQRKEYMLKSQMGAYVRKPVIAAGRRQQPR